MGVFVRIAIGVIVLASFAVSALANGTDDLPAPADAIPDLDEATLYNALHQIRYIKQGDREATTSNCIGNPITPLCAAETYIAAWDDTVLEIAHGFRPGIENYWPDPEYRNSTQCYQISGYWYYHPDDEIFPNRYPIEPGDVALKIHIGTFYHGKCDLFYYKAFPFDAMLMRKGQYGWYRVTSRNGEDYIRNPIRATALPD